MATARPLRQATVDGCFEAAGFIQISTIKELGLGGQVVIGNRKLQCPDPPGACVDPFWEGTVQIRTKDDQGQTVDLFPTPGYGVSLETIGGGSLGVVPFDLHGVDCYPPQGSCLGSLSFPVPNGDPIEIEHYGPVTYDAASANPPLKLFRRPCGGTSWTQLATSQYTVAPTSGDPTGRRLSVWPNNANVFLTAYEYLIVPATTAEMGFEVLYSDESLGTEWPVADYEYRFNINDCPADIDCSGMVDSADLNMVLVNFRGEDEAPQYFPPDIDGDGDVDSTDLNIVLAAFGGTCGCSSGQPAAAMMMGGGVPPVLAALGWTDIAAYTAWVQSLSTKALWEHTLDVVAAAEEIGLID